MLLKTIKSVLESSVKKMFLVMIQSVIPLPNVVENRMRLVLSFVFHQDRINDNR